MESVVTGIKRASRTVTLWTLEYKTWQVAAVKHKCELPVAFYAIQW